jgi:putative DNA primase/helicase
MKTIDAARGRWIEILTKVGGIDPAFLDKKHHPCPVNGDGTDRFRFSDQNGSGNYFCACSQGDAGGIGLLKCKTAREFRDLASEIDSLLGNKAEIEPHKETYAEQIRKRHKKPIARSAYLESRGLEVPPGLQWDTNVNYWDGGEVTGQYSAMLAPIIRDGQFITYHVTYLDKGKKASVPQPRKILPGPSIVGAGIELYPAAAEMGVAEGVETAIAAKMLFDCPTHSALSSGMLAKWKPAGHRKDGLDIPTAVHKSDSGQRARSAFCASTIRPAGLTPACRCLVNVPALAFTNTPAN